MSLVLHLRNFFAKFYLLDWIPGHQAQIGSIYAYDKVQSPLCCIFSQHIMDCCHYNLQTNVKYFHIGPRFGHFNPYLMTAVFGGHENL